MKKWILCPLVFIFVSCQKPGSRSVEKTDISFFVPLRVLKGKLDPSFILPLFQWEVEIDTMAKIEYRYQNIDEDQEDEIILIYLPSNRSAEYAFLFLDKINDRWQTGGYIAQGGEYYSRSDVPDYSPSGKIFWLNEFMNGDCLGGSYLHGYKFINGHIEPVVSIPEYHDGCCDGENCYVLKRQGLVIRDSLITYSVLFTRSKYTDNGSLRDNNFRKLVSFTLYFNDRTYTYLPTDSAEYRFIGGEVLGESTYPFTDVYAMKEYISKKYNIPSL